MDGDSADKAGRREGKFGLKKIKKEEKKKKEKKIKKEGNRKKKKRQEPREIAAPAVF